MIILQSGLMSMNGLGGISVWVTRLGIQESTFFPQVNSNLFLCVYVIYICLTSVDVFSFFYPGDRRVRMLNDMYLQSRDAPLHHCPGLLILVSNHFSGDPFYMELFQDMKHRNYHPFLITPREHSNISESPDEWPQSLFNRPRKSSQGPLPKKPKLDAA